MNWHQLRVGFGIALIFLLVTGGLAVRQVSKIYRGTQEIAGAWLPSVQTLGEMRALANGVRRASLRSLLESDAQRKQAADGDRTRLTPLVGNAKLVSTAVSARLAGILEEAAGNVRTA